MDGLERGEVLLVVGEPEPDVIGPQEVGVSNERDLVGEVCVQVVRHDHVPELEPEAGVQLVVVVEEELGKIKNYFWHGLVVL